MTAVSVDALAATLSVGQTATVDLDALPEDGPPGLRAVAAEGNRVVLAPAPAWLLPPVHPRFAFSSRRLPDTTGTDTVDLWPGDRWSRAAFEAVLGSRRVSSWWLRGLPAAEERLAERIRPARPLLARVSETVAAAHPAANVATVAVNGSYLWRERPASSVDVVAILRGAAEPLLEHHMSVPLAPDSQWTVGGVTVRSLDLLLLGEGALREPDRLTGTLGPWNLPDGTAFPYDLRSSTVATAVRHTLPAGITIAGTDHFASQPGSPADLLALAYYFTQEASVLLAWRVEFAKAAQRLQEANLICGHVESQVGVAGSPGLDADAARRAAEAQRGPVEPPWLARTQGWLGGPDSAVLPRTVARLGRLSHVVAPVTREESGAQDREVAGSLTSEAVRAALREEATRDAARGLAELRRAALAAVGSPGWEQVRRALTGHPLTADLALASLLRTDPDRVAAAVRPGRHPVPAPALEVTDDVVLTLLLWARYGPRLLTRRPLPAAPLLPAVCVADAVRMLTGACLVAIGPNPAAAIGDLWTSHLLEETW